MNAPTILIVDDESDIRTLLRMSLNEMGLNTTEAATLSEARKVLTENIRFCLCDLKLPDGDGLSLIPEATRLGIPIAILTAHGNIEAAVSALKQGAFDFLSKPIDNQKLKILVTTALNDSSVPATSALLVGESETILQLRQKISKIAKSEAPIHISGPSGSGKECSARLIHQCSPRSQGPFIAVNCAAIPPALIESELFGHKKGSFTDASHDREGLFQAAEKGTLFLDEVGELPMEMQAKLLRVIQEKSIRPIGADKESPIDVRLLSATAHSLSELVSKKLFREDLFYRLNVIELSVPALKMHIEDIPTLCEHIINKIVEKNKLKITPKLTKGAIDTLCAYDFPGNIRELENILERTITLCDGDTIQTEDLQLSTVSNSVDNDDKTLDDHMSQIERTAIVEALKKTDGNKTKAAEILGISFRSFRYRLKKLGLE